MSGVLKFLGWFGVLVSISLGMGAIWVFSHLNEPLAAPDGGIIVEVEPGSSIDAVAEKLARLGLISKPRVLVWYARAYGRANKIQAGEYELTAAQSPAQVLQRLVAGKVVQRAHTLVEGWNFRQVMASLKGNPSLKQTLNGVDAAEILVRIGAKETHPEGLFFPDTYRFPKGTTDLDFLGRAYATMRRQLSLAWQQRDPNIPLKTPYEVLILASIVEKETAAPAERAAISGVFVRRLNRKMRLETDPTVIYGLGESFDGNLRRKDLKTDTPYNTYTRKGLPPTPIAMPGAAALRAATRPKKGTELFFVSRGDGTHVFSNTYQEHLRAVRKYQLGKS